MLSIQPIRPGGENYYLDLGREDYYLEGGEPPGFWLGEGSTELGLMGQVEKDDLRALFDGFSPTGEKLVQNAGKKNRLAGTDLCYSAPKDFSILWALAPDEATRRALERTELAAVRTFVNYLEENATVTRRGADGSDIQHSKLIAAAFSHSTSRNQDMNRHHHVLFLTPVKHEDGWGAARNREFYQHRMAAGLLAQAEHAYQLKNECDLNVTQHKNWWRINGVSDKARDFWSSRAQEIQEKMDHWNLSGAEAASRVAEGTRNVKGHVSHKELGERWEKEGETIGMNANNVTRILHPKEPTLEVVNQEYLIRHDKAEVQARSHADRAVKQAVAELEGHRSYFPIRTIVERTAARLQNGESGAQTILSAIESFVRSPEHIVSLGKHNGHELVTTRNLFEAEQQTLHTAHTGRHDRRHIVTDESLEKAQAKPNRFKKTLGARDYSTLYAEQENALKTLTQGQGSVTCLIGRAGTGKTFVLGAAREAWEASGYQVVGMAQASKAARELEAGSGIKSDTVALEQIRQRDDVLATTRHAIGQVGRAAQKKTTFSWDGKAKDFKAKLGTRLQHTLTDLIHGQENKSGWNRWDSETILVVDEAATLGTKDTHWLVKQAQKTGAKLVLCGDDKQLPSVAAGSPFKLLTERCTTATLKENRRQKVEWQRDAAHLIAESRHTPKMTQPSTPRPLTPAKPEKQKTFDELCKPLEDRAALATALGLYADNGNLLVRKDEEGAMGKLIADWKEHRTADLKETLILAGTNREANLLNKQAQMARREAGELGRQSVYHDGVRYRAKDRIVFTANDRGLGVRNGDAATIASINNAAKTMRVTLDERETWHGIPLPVRKTVSFNLNTYDGIQLGYAVTTHKAQGATVDTTFAFVSPNMLGREMTYVQLTRHRDDCTIYATNREVGEDLERTAEAGEKYADKMKKVVADLSQDMSKQNTQPLATEKLDDLEEDRPRGLSLG